MKSELESAFKTAQRSWPANKCTTFQKNKIVIATHIDDAFEAIPCTVVERAMLMLELATMAYEQMIEAADAQLLAGGKQL